MIYADLDSKTSRYITPADAEWPRQLDDLAEPPAGLWVLGDGRLNELAARAVAITGSRASTAYGDVVAAELGDQLSAAGLTVVNGGGYGIEAAALRGANSVATPSIVVQASGLDCLYPSGHASLFKAVVAYGGLIVTERAMGAHPTRAAFVRRNELLAALGMGTVMVEAAARSGARHTMSMAAELGRQTMAVPGPVTSITSRLPHQLISSGAAALVVDGAAVLQVLGH